MTALATAPAHANAKYAAIVVDANTGKTLFSSSADAARYPASLTKMMTLYLTFEALQSGSGPLVLMVFDLLELDGEAVHQRPLRERRELLEQVLDPQVRGVRLSPAFEDGEALLAAARAQGLEGVVAKRADMPYRPGRRTPEWRKVKLRDQEDFPIVGYTRGEGRRAKLGTLVLARREADGLYWAGKLLYPHLFTEDLHAKTAEFYRLFYHREPDAAQLDALLGERGVMPR